MTYQAFRQSNFQSGQQPHAWLSSAERLRAAAEVVLQREAQQVEPYLEAYRKAEEKLASGQGSTAAIEADPPNYPPGELLFGYAIENVLKGLIVANDSTIPDKTKLANELASHKLVDLAAAAHFQISGDEATVLEALTTLTEWAGRYPVARRLDQHTTIEPLDDVAQLMSFGRDHSTLRTLFERAVTELESKLKFPRVKYSILVRTD
jgi:hypothetical protein